MKNKKKYFKTIFLLILTTQIRKFKLILLNLSPKILS